MYNDNQAPAEPNNTLFVRNLNWEIESKDLEEIFSQEAEIVSARVLWDRERQRSKGCGFVEFKDVETAQAVKEKMNEQEIAGRQVFIDFARKREAA